MSAPEKGRLVFLGLGSNLGERERSLALGILELSKTPEIKMLRISSIYETEPLGFASQPDFLNMLVAIQTTLTPEALLAICQQIEKNHGRTRTFKNAPRTLDIDLLWFENEQRNTPALTLPHPRMLERAFVITPLLELLHSPDLKAVELRALLKNARPVGEVKRA